MEEKCGHLIDYLDDSLPDGDIFFSSYEFFSFNLMNDGPNLTRDELTFGFAWVLVSLVKIRQTCVSSLVLSLSLSL